MAPGLIKMPWLPVCPFWGFLAELTAAAATSMQQCCLAPANYPSLSTTKHKHMALICSPICVRFQWIDVSRLSCANLVPMPNECRTGINQMPGPQTAFVKDSSCRAATASWPCATAPSNMRAALRTSSRRLRTSGSLSQQTNGCLRHFRRDSLLNTVTVILTMSPVSFAAL